MSGLRGLARHQRAADEECGGRRPSTQIASQWAAHRGVEAAMAAAMPMQPMTTPAVPGTTMEPDNSMDVRM